MASNATKVDLGNDDYHIAEAPRSPFGLLWGALALAAVLAAMVFFNRKGR